MYDILVYTNGPKAYAPRRILEEAEKSGVAAGVQQYRPITLNFSDDKLPQAKSIFIRGMGEDVNHLPLKYFIINYYRDNARILNFKSFDKWLSLDKITQHIEFEKMGIPSTNSYYFGSREAALQSLEKLTYPLICKFNAGSKGMSVYKISSADEIDKILEKHDIRTMLFQNFMPGAEDLRIIVLNGKILGAMKRIAKKGEYLTNFSQGGRVVGYDIESDTNASKIALHVAESFNLDYCGVDLMKDKDGEWKVLEVNRACQFQGFEKSTGINVAAEIVNFLTTK